MNEQVETIKKWLGSGSINIFGKPFAGKDTQGEKLAELFGGSLISSGDVLRHSSQNQELQKLLDAGDIIPTEMFKNIVIPYLQLEKFNGQPLILSAVGRMNDEHLAVIEATEHTSHPTKAVVYLDMPSEEVYRRFEAAQESGDRGQRGDDSKKVLTHRVEEFDGKVIPIIDWYETNGYLLRVDGMQDREAVTASILEALHSKAQAVG